MRLAPSKLISLLREELRRDHMALLLELGDVSTALARSDELLLQQSDDKAALRVKALAQYTQWITNAKGKPEEVAESLKKLTWQIQRT